MCSDTAMHDLLPQKQWLAHITKKRESRDRYKIIPGVQSSSDVIYYLYISSLIVIPICKCLLCPAYEVESNTTWVVCAVEVLQEH
jgi:hypothetical protein